MFTILDGRKDFFQWDLNQKIVVSEKVNRVHFAIGGKIEATEVKQENEQYVAAVPNIILQNAGYLSVYAYVADENGSFTKEESCFLIKGRPKPPDYVYTETEVLNYEAIRKEIEQIEKRLKKVEETGGEGGSGVPGGYYVPSVSKNGVLSWDASNEEMPEVPEANIKGPAGYTPQKGIDYFDGEPGEPGENGKTPNIQIGEVVTLEPGAEATAEITGTPEEPRLNLGIPQGKPGEGGSSAEVTAESIKNALGFVPANPSAIPTRNSELLNDEEFVKQEDIEEYAQPKGDYALKKEIPSVPTKVSAFENDADYAKRSEIPKNTSDLNNDSGFITEKDIPAIPEVPVKSVNGKTGAVQLNASDVGADENGTATEKVGEHNADTTAHPYIQALILKVEDLIKAFLDIDNPTFDQLSELIAQIEANAGTIEQLTNGKVNVADIVNNLTSNVANKPLSAAQGVILKGLVDNLSTVANNAAATAGNAATAANEAKNLATTANTNATAAKETAQNASNKVDNLEERMDSGEFVGPAGKDYVLTDADKEEIANLTPAVRYDETQTLTETQKAQARANIGAPTVTQGAGQSESLVMSQKAVTDLVNDMLGGGSDREYEIVDSVAEMTDKSKGYILSSTGTIWRYQTTTVETETEMTEQIVGTAENPWGAGRLSSGNPNGEAGYVTTPYIDLQKFSAPFKLHLKGITFSYTTYGSATQGNLRYAQYDTSKAHLKTEMTQASSFETYWSGAVLTDIGDGTVEIAFTPPVTNKSVNVGYARFSGYGTEANANVYIIYVGKTTTTGEAWVDTGIAVADISTFILENPAVKGFMATADYSDDDYSYTNVLDYAGSDYYRKDIPLPVVLEWEKDRNVMQTTVCINTLSSVIGAGMQTYYTDDNRIAIYNLIPNKTYYYKVYGLYVNSSGVLLKEGSFTTTADKTRMLNIDGIQNVRDIGGYTGLDKKKVKYGLLFRGSAMDEDYARNLCITDKGKEELCERIGIRTDYDLRSEKNESALGEGITYFKVDTSYGSYADIFTNSVQKANFKTILENIVKQLSENLPIYIHCQGGCDRTGTLVFQLLGLLGVSESNLAKEYELSSLSSIGYGRFRNSTSYNYKGMVEALKAYSGSTITEKFYNFAVTGCGIAADTITAFRNLMLE